MSTTPPEKGAEIVLRQEYLAREFGPNSYEADGYTRKRIRKHIRATVVYVRRRGDFDVDVAKIGKFRVQPSGDASGYARGDLRALRWRGGWLRPDQLPQLLAAEERRAS